jgi:hypothetical protein
LSTSSEIAQSKIGDAMVFRQISVGSFLSACTLGAALIVFSAPARASLIVEGNAVLDPTTNLQWLDATVTENMSPNQALATNPGYQFATWAQVETLLEDNGIPASVLPNTPATPYDPSNFLTLSQPLLALFNYSIFPPGTATLPPDGSSYETNGNVLNTTGTGAGLVSFQIQNALFSKGITVTYSDFSNDLGSSGGGNFDFLVMPVATPIGSTLPLFAGGLGFVGYLTRRRKKNSTQALAAV